MKIVMLLILPIIVFTVIIGVIWKLVIEYITQTYNEKDKEKEMLLLENEDQKNKG